VNLRRAGRALLVVLGWIALVLGVLYLAAHQAAHDDELERAAPGRFAPRNPR